MYEIQQNVNNTKDHNQVEQGGEGSITLDNPVWTALITPFREDGSVHMEDLIGLVRRQDAAGNGILLFGSTGEGLALSTREKREILDEVRTLSLRVPLMVGVGGSQLETQLEWIEHCNAGPANAFLLVAPPYAKPGEAGMVHWFRALMDRSEHPCMIYNIPSRSGVKITPSVLNQLSDHPNCWAVKEASGSIRDYCEFTKRVPGVTFYAGDDGMFPFFSRVGTKGVVSVASNIWPLQTRMFVEACFRHATVPDFHEWNASISALFSAPNPIPVKAMMKFIGFLESDRLRLPLSRADLREEDLERLRIADAAMKEWLFRDRVDGRTGGLGLSEYTHPGEAGSGEIGSGEAGLRESRSDESTLRASSRTEPKTVGSMEEEP